MKKPYLLLLLVMVMTVTTATTATVTVDFPESSDTWGVSSYPYWWHVGDTVYGDRELGSEEFDEVTIHLPISYNSLNSGGHVDLELRLDGTTVTDFSIVESDGTGMWEDTFTISYTPSGTEEVRYYETNQVTSGAGSISIGTSGGYLDFETVDTAVQATSLGMVKALFK